MHCVCMVSRWNTLYLVEHYLAFKNTFGSNIASCFAASIITGASNQQHLGHLGVGLSEMH